MFYISLKVHYKVFKFMKKILCILGPTGSGKTGFSIEIAEYFKKKSKKIYVINADSRQVYKDFPIITAQPTHEERKDIPHFLYSILDIKSKNNAGLWLNYAYKEIEKCYQENAIPLFVGGTGMYIKTLTEGIADIPDIPAEISQEILNELKTEGKEKLYKDLQSIDEAYSKKIHQNDTQRICRALEVYRATKKSLTFWHTEAHKQSEYTTLKLGVGMPLDELSPYLYKRTELMLEQGAIQEAEQALKICNDLNTPGWSGIGCKELASYLVGNTTLDEALELWNKNTRAYAKRQWTWFRADKSIEWCHPLQTKERTNIIEKIESFIE